MKIIKNIIHYVFLAICFIVIVPIVVFNGTIILKGLTHPDEVPTVFGYAPLIAQSGQIGPEIDSGDLVFVKHVDISKLKENDVIGVWNSEVVILKKITNIRVNGEMITFQATDDNYESTVDAMSIVGQYQFKIAGLGKFFLWIQTPVGMIFFLGVPLLIFLIIYTWGTNEENDKLEQENKKMKVEMSKLKKKKS